MLPDQTHGGQAETLDEVGMGGLRIFQKKQGFRFTLDGVLLAHFLQYSKKDRIVDLGTGTGIIPLILSCLGPKTLDLAGLELLPAMAHLAQRSVELNGKTQQIKIFCGDLRQEPYHFSAQSCQGVVVNPPYWSPGRGKSCQNQQAQVARQQMQATLPEIIRAAGRLLVDKGRLSLIYPAARLGELIQDLAAESFKVHRLRGVQSFGVKPAGLVLVEARKRGGDGGLTLLPPMVVYEAPGQFSQEIRGWYDGTGAVKK